MSKTIKKYLTEKDKRLAVFLWLLILTFIVYRKSLGLTLYGDDWLVISKYLGGYGPGKAFGYFDPRVWISNYGFQYSISLLYKIFGENYIFYFIVSLISRAVLAFTIFLFISGIYNFKTALFGATFFAITLIGAETTDFVYNFNSYWGITAALLGLKIFLESKSLRSKLKAWVLMLIGYILVPIRLFILPFLMFLLIFFREFTTRKSVKIKNLPTILLLSSFGLFPFLILKVVDPFLGWQTNLTFMIREGTGSGLNMITQGKYDFLLTPFTTLGKMIIPLGPNMMQEKGWLVYPIFNFIRYGFVLLVLGFLFFISYFRKSAVFLSILIATVLLIFLKFFVRYQNTYNLKDFAFFSWTYFGLIMSVIFIIHFIYLLAKKNTKKLLLFLIGIVFLIAFMFPWLYIPGVIFEPQHRYLVLSSVGFSILLAITLSPAQTSQKLKIYAQTALLSLIILVHVFSVNNYFRYQLKGRNTRLNQYIFTQIQSYVPQLPSDKVTVFYFENFDPWVYENLLRASFGYHMQLIYNSKFDEQILPFSVANFNDLEKAVSDKSFTDILGYKEMPDVKNVYGFRMSDGGIENITDSTRARLSNLEK
ncbi:MAG: hypothetical protein UT23_C0005G0048 [Candidatus Woesebacteria bacterium GW2011_GWA1_39_12]|uniref:Glycosyltransferase RgtA/B/C/D-like domain-containing protein n=1 Tax=Candidatus Woesebacteria bacterium GW2011_GWA1_39_12 TaxID=1618549 RepID=A0A0G0MCU4_9BACT|nr:MAG: hypothetical protein UT23_C0005G0048 [Candidatus Woesebacteria bacterium GW2011_GWA1_39_12]